MKTKKEEEMYKCPSYYDDNNVLRDCSCGECANKLKKEDKCKKHQFFHGRCITCREPIHHGLNKCMCDICHTPATKDDRCNKCNSPFQYHHNIHEVDGKIYHTGCKPACPMCKLREKEGYCKCSTHREDLDETIYNCGDFGCNKHLSTEETNFNEKWGDKPIEKLVTIIGSLAQDSDDSEWFSKDSYKRACKEVEDFVADKLAERDKEWEKYIREGGELTTIWERQRIIDILEDMKVSQWEIKEAKESSDGLLAVSYRDWNRPLTKAIKEIKNNE